MKFRTNRIVFATTLAAAIGLGGVTSTVAADPGGGRSASDQKVRQPYQDRQDAQQRLGRMRQASGEILAIKTVRLPDDLPPHLVALLDTRRGDQRLVVDLGPRNRLTRQQRAALELGDRIAVEGQVTVVKGVQVLMADRVRAGNREFRIQRPELQRMRQQQRQQFDRQQQQREQQRRQEQRERQQRQQQDIDEFEEFEYERQY